MKDNANTRTGIALTAAQLRESRAKAGYPSMTQAEAVRIVRQANLNVERDQTRKG
jgi:predicted TPR repeat methyltransferase